ncbi:MAG: hypothetical protein NZ518_04715 [Dehalococcoidia bacterium]|nr:hypothetical protein [Dehalococcoidia bacterium]
MDVLDLFRVVLRGIHVLASVVWIGGSAFYLLVLNPTFADAVIRQNTAEARAAIAMRFREVTGTCLFALLVTGVIISYDRLADARFVTWGYVATLVAKLVVVAAMYVIYRRLGDRRAPKRRWASGETLLGLGVVVYFLTMLLQLLYERAVRGAVL